MTSDVATGGFEQATVEFRSAATWLATLAAEVRADQWEAPGLGSWDVRALLGHACRALGTVEEYVARPAEAIDATSPLEYLGAVHLADPAAIAQRGVAAGEALGDDPAHAVRALADRVTALVERTSGDATLSTALGGMRLADYLPTRTLELVVHGLDLATAIGSSTPPPRDATDATARLIAEAMIANGDAAALCEVLTGRPVAHGQPSVF